MEHVLIATRTLLKGHSREKCLQQHEADSHTTRYPISPRQISLKPQTHYRQEHGAQRLQEYTHASTAQ